MKREYGTCFEDKTQKSKADDKNTCFQVEIFTSEKNKCSRYKEHECNIGFQGTEVELFKKPGYKREYLFEPFDQAFREIQLIMELIQ